MVVVNASEARNNIGKLWSRAIEGPVTVTSAGRPVAVVLSPADFEALTARRRGARAGFARHLFAGTDVNALLNTDISEVFEGYL